MFRPKRFMPEIEFASAVTAGTGYKDVLQSLYRPGSAGHSVVATDHELTVYGDLEGNNGCQSEV